MNIERDFSDLFITIMKTKPSRLSGDTSSPIVPLSPGEQRTSDVNIGCQTKHDETRQTALFRIFEDIDLMLRRPLASFLRLEQWICGESTGSELAGLWMSLNRWFIPDLPMILMHVKSASILRVCFPRS
ncbi:Lipase [Fusarium oxysporum f. sp. albedinis]|nr:Lipase [Fusarium oxysporum f. sp. albedinis]